MNNVDKAMMLADEYGNDRFFRGADGCKYGEEKTRQSLRTHIEAMEADRVRLLEALQGAIALADKNKAEAEANGFRVVRPPAMQAMYDKCVAAISKATGGQS